MSNVPLLPNSHRSSRTPIWAHGRSGKCWCRNCAQLRRTIHAPISKCPFLNKTREYGKPKFGDNGFTHSLLPACSLTKYCLWCLQFYRLFFFHFWIRFLGDHCIKIRFQTGLFTLCCMAIICAVFTPNPFSVIIGVLAIGSICIGMIKKLEFVVNFIFFLSFYRRFRILLLVGLRPGPDRDGRTAHVHRVVRRFLHTCKWEIENPNKNP